MLSFSIPLPALHQQIVLLWAIPSTEDSCCCKLPTATAGIPCPRKICLRRCPGKALSPPVIPVCWWYPATNSLWLPALSLLAFFIPLTLGKTGPCPQFPSPRITLPLEFFP